MEERVCKLDSASIQLQRWSGNASLIKSPSLSLSLSSLFVGWNLFRAFQSPSIQFGHPSSLPLPPSPFSPFSSSFQTTDDSLPLCASMQKRVTVAAFGFFPTRAANSDRRRPRSRKTAISPKRNNLVFPIFDLDATRYSATCSYQFVSLRERDSSPGGNLSILGVRFVPVYLDDRFNRLFLCIIALLRERNRERWRMVSGCCSIYLLLSSLF